jgi:hypothetical protein
LSVLASESSFGLLLIFKTSIMKKSILTISLLLVSLGLLAENAPAEKPIPICKSCTLDGFDQMIASSPLIIFLLIVVVIFWKLNKEGYKIGDALKENTTIEISEDNPSIAEPPRPTASNGLTTTPDAPAPTNNQPPFVPKTIQPKSTSRLIAFISGLISVGLACSISSFWIYRHLSGVQTVDLSHLTNVLLALGIGVVPYAVNKLSTGK